MQRGFGIPGYDYERHDLTYSSCTDYNSMEPWRASQQVLEAERWEKELQEREKLEKERLKLEKEKEKIRLMLQAEKDMKDMDKIERDRDHQANTLKKKKELLKRQEVMLRAEAIAAAAERVQKERSTIKAATTTEKERVGTNPNHDPNFKPVCKFDGRCRFSDCKKRHLLQSVTARGEKFDCLSLSPTKPSETAGLSLSNLYVSLPS